MLNIDKKSLISTLSLTVVLTVGALGTTRPASAAELVVNGSFEQGSNFDADGWTREGVSSAVVSTAFFRTGVSAWVSQAFDPGRDTIAQTITGLTAGQSATISFWVANARFSSPSVLDVSIGGLSLFTIRDQPAGSSDPGDFVNFTTTFVSPSTAPVLLFSGFNNPGSIWVDDVSITVADVPTGVPEPSAVVGLVAIGTLVAGSSWKKRPRRR
jgi:hypothetical protein